MVPLVRSAGHHAILDKVGVVIQDLLRIFAKLGYALDNNKENSRVLNSSLIELSTPEAEVSSIDKPVIPSTWLDDQTKDTVRPFWTTNYEFVAVRPGTPLARNNSAFFGPGVPYQGRNFMN